MLDEPKRRRRRASPQDSTPLSSPRGEYRSLTQIIAAQLRKHIYDGSMVGGEYAPGARLNIADLAKRLDVSPIPVREALRRLEAEGLVEFQLNRGVVVRRLSAAELRELFLVRLPLETLAAVEAARWADAGSLRSLAATLEEMDATGPCAAWHELHERFHEQLYALSRLPRLSQMVAGLRGQMRPYARLYHDDPEQLRHVQAEHYALLKALRRRDSTKIPLIIREHLSRPARVALAKLSDGKNMAADFSPR